MQRYDIHLYKKCQLSVKIREKCPIEDIDAAKCAIDYSPSNIIRGTYGIVTKVGESLDVEHVGAVPPRAPKHLREYGRGQGAAFLILRSTA